VYLNKYNDILLYSFHGDLPAEQELGQKFLVNVDVWTSLETAQKSDLLKDTVNYVTVAIFS